MDFITIPNFGDGYKSDNKIVGDEVLGSPNLASLQISAFKAKGFSPIRGKT
jgi:hypothetical protein